MDCLIGWKGAVTTGRGIVSWQCFHLTFSFARQKLNSYFKESLGQKGITIKTILLRPKSRGSLTLHSRNPQDPPVVDVAYLSHPEDVATLVDGEKQDRLLGRQSGER